MLDSQPLATSPASRADDRLLVEARPATAYRALALRRFAGCLLIALLGLGILPVAASGGQPDSIFADGFELGHLGRWSMTEPPIDVPTEGTTGIVDRFELGGEGLRVVSPWSSPRDVGPDGGFEVEVSRAGAQLLSLIDEDGELRGLALSLLTTGRGSLPLVFEAHSTALALLVMTPGILTVQGTELLERVVELELLPEFGALVDLLRARLPDAPLGEVVVQEDVQAALRATVEAWRDEQLDEVGFSASPSTGTNELSVSLENRAWSYVSVYRRDRLCTAEVGVQKLSLSPYVDEMSGRTAASWGSLFTAELASPGQAVDVVDFASLSRVEYWVQTGVGRGGSNVVLPLGVPSDRPRSAGLTVAYYVALPVLDLIVGAGDLAGDAWAEAVESIVTGIEAEVELAELLEASTREEQLSATLDASLATLELLAAIGSSAGAAGFLGISAPVWAKVGVVLTVASFGFSGANLVIAVDSWGVTPRIQRLVVDDESPSGCSPTEGMVLVPSGSFWMGCNGTVDEDCDDDEGPYHQVEMDAYWIDATEVTQRAYRECVIVGECEAPDISSPRCNWDYADREEHPVNCVSWEDASAYCGWLGRRLPSEAEREKAARTSDGRIFPWGNDPAPGCDRAVMYDFASEQPGCGLGTTWPVGSRPLGVSQYGAYDLLGNVWEWVNDRYSASYYAISPPSNPPGPDTGELRVLRGASWGFNFLEYWRTSERARLLPTYQDEYIGFRCAGPDALAESSLSVRGFLEF